MRQTCKIATSDEGMEKLMDHTLQRQLAEHKKATDDLKAQVAELALMLRSQAIVPAGQGEARALVTGDVATVVNGAVQQLQDQRGQINIANIEKIEIRPWNSSQAVLVGVTEILAAFTENARLQEYARLPDHALVDPESAPPYVADLYTDLVKRGHADPASRNIYLNPRRADQVLVQLAAGTWEVKPATEGYRALLDGVATSVRRVTLSTEERKQLPLEAQNALAMAGLLYNSEPEAYVELAKAALAAHLTNMAPPSALAKK
jgi:hypothetical protein